VSLPQDDPWAACTWKGSWEEVLRRGRQMTFREKIIWLEAAARLTERLRAAPDPDRPRPRTGG
jgi:hypothetical protein